MTSPTALMPLNPAIGPEQANRILPIRANLLPEEITTHRNARRMEFIVIAAVVTVVVALGGWYFHAYQTYQDANADLAAVTERTDQVRAAMHKKDLADVTRITQTNKTMAGQLKTLMANDLPWSTLLDQLRSTGTANGVTVTSINAMTADAQASNGKPTAATKGAVATLTIGGTASDKKTAAAFIDALIGVKGLANPYLTTATQSGASSHITFTANAEVTSAALCGRYTTACTTGGK